MKSPIALIVLTLTQVGVPSVFGHPEASVKPTSVKPLTGAELASMVMAPMEYIGPITPGGRNHTLYGTAEQIHGQIKKLNPKFNPDDFDELKGPKTSRNLSPRNKIDPPNCNVFDYAAADIIQNGINYLESLPGGCGVGAGPRTCVRISCSYNAGIFLCNDNNYAIAPSCKYLGGNYAQDIHNNCFKQIDSCRGQVFDTDKYNVIVNYSSC